MEKIGTPNKYAIRTWLTQELEAHRPPPTPERIREVLGWKLVRDMGVVKQ